MEPLVRVAWYSKISQKFAWTLINIFHMYNVRKKCVERNLRRKNEASSSFEKSFFQQQMLDFDCFGASFS